MNKLHNTEGLLISPSISFAISRTIYDLNYWSGFLFLTMILLGLSNVNAQIGCIGDLNTTLDENCGNFILPEMVLTGDYTSADLIEITVDGQETNYLTGCGLHTYTVEAYANGELLISCWGDIMAEDKTPPNLTCPAGTDEAVLLNDMQVFRGGLSEESSQFDPSQQSCYIELVAPLEIGDRYYGTHTFSISNSDIYTFIGTAAYDGMIGLYQGEFLPDNPCQNLIAQSDDTFLGNIDDFDPIVPDINPSFRLSLNLQPNQSYTLVWTSQEPLQTGDYGVAVFADDNGRVVNLSKSQVELAAELVCLDVEDILLINSYTYSVSAAGNLILDYDDPFRIPQELRNVLSFTGYPEVTDNCSDMLVTVYDELEEDGDCGNWTITRNFSVADRYDSDCEDPPLVSTCTQTIIVRKPTLNDLVLPPFTTLLECDEGFTTDGDTGGPEDNPSPEAAGFPYLATAVNFYNLDQSVCNIGASYSDEPRVTTCPGSYYFRREWTIVDWCDPQNNFIYDQIVRVGDFTGPAISFDIPDNNHDGEPDLYYQYSTSPSSCLANIIVPNPVVSDGNGCSGIQQVLVQINDATGDYLWNGTPATLVQLPIGDYTFIYCATDECGNESCSEVALEVRDRIAPTAVCNDEIIISIGGGDTSINELGTATLSAADLDEGSSDHCSTVSLAVRREEDQSWTDNVNFTCSDIGTAIRVFLLVTDTAQNTNTCWIEVTPEDKLKPHCIAPADVTLGCVELPLSFPGDVGIAYLTNFGETSRTMNAIFGSANGTDNCAVDTVVERSPNISINECGWGTLTRRFEAWQLRPTGDTNGNNTIDINEVVRSNNNCQQLITITEVHQFTIDFPEDASADCGNPDVPTIITASMGCDVLAVNISDPTTFSATGEECYKYSLTYDVINWCLWDGEYDGYVLERLTEDDGEPLAIDRAVEGNERPVVRYNDLSGLVIDRKHNDREGDSQLPNTSPDLPNYGRYIYTQFVKVYDNTVPVIEVGYYGGPTDLCPELLEGQFGDVTGDCTADVSIPFQVTDECELFDGAGNLVISIVSAELDAFAVDTNNDGDIKSNEFTAEDGPAGDVLSNITDNGDGTYSFDGTFPIITSAMGDNVFHAIRILLEDGCGNQSSIIIAFDVIDCKAPAPICINGLTVTLMPQIGGGCAMSIWAVDFEGSPIYDCTGQGPETENGLLQVNSYAIYRASDVENNPDFAPNPADDGLVLTQEDEASTVVYIYAFDEEGNYDYCETYVLVQEHVDCNAVNATIAGVIATENNAAIAGVEVSRSGNTSQTVVTNQAGEYSFSNLETGTDLSITPYLNANPTNGVTTFDLVLISKHILGISLLDSPYKMIAADANHSESITTLDMIQIRKLVLQINTVFPNNTSWRFVDADYSFPNFTDPWQEFFPELVNFNNITEMMHADFVGVKIGDVNGSAQTNLSAHQDRNLEGSFDFQLEDQLLVAGESYNIPFQADDLHSLEGFQVALSLQGVSISAIHYGQAQAENFNLITTNKETLLVSWNNNVSSSNKEELFFELTLTATMDISLREALTINERMMPAEAYLAGEQLNLGLRFTHDTEQQLSLRQNRPNPFRENSQVVFNLPYASTVTFSISNSQGKVIHTLKKSYPAGEHTIMIDRNMLQKEHGVLSYTLANDQEVITKKMVVIP